jgi:hypothetical protein
MRRREFITLLGRIQNGGRPPHLINTASFPTGVVARGRHRNIRSAEWPRAANCRHARA